MTFGFTLFASLVIKIGYDSESLEMEMPMIGMRRAIKHNETSNKDSNSVTCKQFRVMSFIKINK